MPQGQFPIEYSQSDIGAAGGGVRSSLSVDTGHRQIAQAVSGLGEAVDERNEKIKLGQNAMRMSVLERDYDELTSDYERQLSEITDEEEANKLMADYETQIYTLTGKDNPEVQAAFEISMNEKIGEQTDVFKEIGKAARAKDAVDQYKFSYGRAIDAGNAEGAMDLHPIKSS